MAKYILLTTEQARTDGLENQIRFQPLQLLSGPNKGKFVCHLKCQDVFPKIIGNKPTIIDVDAAEFENDYSITKVTVEFLNSKGEVKEVELTEKELYLLNEKVREENDKPLTK